MQTGELNSLSLPLITLEIYVRKDLADLLDTINSKQMIKLLSWIVAVAGAVLVTTYYAYIQEFHAGFSAKQEVWGQFGDFIGGTVNPVLSFLSLLALVFTVVLQTRQLENSRTELSNSKAELEATREEMRRSAEAQREVAKAAQAQAEYANASARLSALNAALAVTSESLAQAQQAGVLAGPDTYRHLLQRKEQIANEILRLTDHLCRDDR